VIVLVKLAVVESSAFCEVALSRVTELEWLLGSFFVGYGVDNTFRLVGVTVEDIFNTVARVLAEESTIHDCRHICAVNPQIKKSALLLRS
jgi:hypothetical protein